MRALSGATRQLSQRESPWHVGQVYAGRAKHDVPGTVVLRCLGSRQLDKERCPEAAVPVSKARPFAPYRASGVQWEVARPANGSPFGGAGAKRLRGQARHERTAHAAISRLFVRAMLSLRPRITVSILALSVTCGDTSPKGRGFVRTGKVCKNYKNPLQTSPRCGIIHLAASPLEIEYLPL